MSISSFCCTYKVFTIADIQTTNIYVDIRLRKHIRLKQEYEIIILLQWKRNTRMRKMMDAITFNQVFLYIQVWFVGYTYKLFSSTSVPRVSHSNVKCFPKHTLLKKHKHRWKLPIWEVWFSIMKLFLKMYSLFWLHLQSQFLC